MSFISRLHTSLRQKRIAHRAVTTDAIRALPKRYERMPHVQLPQPETDVAFENEMLVKNDATMLKIPPRDYPPAVYSALLSHVHDALQKQGRDDAPLYTSLEAYLITESDYFPQPILHYDPHAHALDGLWGFRPNSSFGDLYTGNNDIAPSNLIVCTCVWDSLYAAYGDYAYAKALLDIGGIVQAIRTAAHHLNIPSRVIESYDDQLMTHVLDLDPEHEQPLSVIAF